MSNRSLQLVLAVTALTGLGCKHSLNTNAITFEPPVNQVALERVEWWANLVRPPLLEYGPTELAAPAVDASKQLVVLLTRDGIVHAVKFGGEEAWTFEAKNRFVAGALIDSGVVYVPGGDGIFYELDEATGKERWRHETGEELASVPVLAGDKVLVASQTDSLYALDRESGKWLWQYRRESAATFSIRGASGAVVRGDHAFIGFSDGHVVSLALNDGTVKWDRALSSGTQFTDVDTTPLIGDDQRLFVASFRDGLYELDSETGETKWHVLVTGINHMVRRGEVLFGTGADKIGAWLTTNGQAVWVTELKDRGAQAPVLARQFLAVPTGGELLFVDLRTGKKLLEWDPGKGVTAPATWRSGSLYVLSNNGSIYSLEVLSGVEGS